MTRRKDAAGLTVRGHVTVPPYDVEGRLVFVVAVTQDHPEVVGGERQRITINIRATVGPQTGSRAAVLTEGRRVIVAGRLLPPVTAEFVEMFATEIARSL